MEVFMFKKIPLKKSCLFGMIVGPLELLPVDKMTFS